MLLIRELHRGMRGPDVRALKRALKKAGFGKGIVLTARFGSSTYADLILFQRKHGLTPDGVLGQKTLEKLWPFVDKYGRSLFKRAPKQSPEDLIFDKLFAAMKLMSDLTPGYLLGGGHGIPLWQIDPSGRTDCSSSCSYVLWKAGLLNAPRALVSWELEDWGLSGTGKYFTVYANGEHVWIRLYKTRYWRFDTSPHGDGGRGPHFRILPRFTSSFVARHAKGM